MIEDAAKAGRPFELVLMDMQMPEMDGLEATRRLREAGHLADALPIVALTANAYPEDIQACIAAGMQAHMAKPVRVRDLTDVLSRFVLSDPPAAAEPPVVSSKLMERYQERKGSTLLRLDAARGSRPSRKGWPHGGRGPSPQASRRRRPCSATPRLADVPRNSRTICRRAQTVITPIG